MSIEALVMGKLHQPAEQRTGRTGRPFVVAKVRAAVGGDADAVFVNVAAFSESACAALLALQAGDSVALAGTLKPGAWIDREGSARPSVDLVAAQVLTVYGLAKKRATVRVAAELGEPDRAARPGATAAQDEGSGQGFGSGADDPWLNGGAA